MNQYTPKKLLKNHYPEYLNWRSMIKRSKYKNGAYYDIEVYEPWLDFFVFLKDVGSKPTKDHTIDRKDNSKGYIPGNVRWATRSEQQANRRMFKNNKTGVKGISMRNGKYRAVYMRKELGIYGTLKEAKLAYNKAMSD